MTTARPGEVGSQEWIAEHRKNDTCLQTRLIDSYEVLRTRHRAEHGDHAGEPIPAGTTFTMVGRKMADDEQH